ncbi:DUF6531 domain-containing protein [Escherichia coli]
MRNDGKPAARQGDITARDWILCRVRRGADRRADGGCLLGVSWTVGIYGNPVNPVLGAKVLPGETDIALPGPLPFVAFPRLQQLPDQDARAGRGVWSGWKAPFDIRLQIRDEGLILNDSGGRSITLSRCFPAR